MKRILSVDDHGVVREGLKSIAAEIPGGAEVGEARTFTEALHLSRGREWDIVVLDISLDGRNGLELLRELKRRRPELPVLVLSMHTEEQYARRAFRAGASGYITKDSSRQELLEAISRVIRGGRYVSPAIAEQMVVNLAAEDDRPVHESLSDREYQVLCLIASGRTVSEIAEMLLLSDKTISTYRARILEKMRLKTNAELTSYAIRNNLVH